MGKGGAGRRVRADQNGPLNEPLNEPLNRARKACASGIQTDAWKKVPLREGIIQNPPENPRATGTQIKQGGPPFLTHERPGVSSFKLRFAGIIALTGLPFTPQNALCGPAQGFWVCPLKGLTAPGTGTPPSQAPNQSADGTANRSQTPQKAAFASAPWTAKTGDSSALRLQNKYAEIRVSPKTHFELTPTGAESQPLAAPSLSSPTESPVVRSALKALSADPLKTSRLCAAVRLHEGSLCFSKNREPAAPTVLVARTLNARCLMSGARASLSSDAWGNTRICVFDGEVHVRTLLGASFTLKAGHTAKIESAMPASRGLLEEYPDALHQRHLFDSLIKAVPIPGRLPEGDFSPPPQTLPPPPAEAVGSGAIIPFDLKSRRRSVLLQPPSPGVDSPEDVSPELPLPQ